MEAAPPSTVETTENLNLTQQTPEPPPEAAVPYHHWDTATSIQPYAQPQNRASPPLQIQTTQQTHQQPPIPLQPTPPTQSSTEAQLAALVLIQLITQQTMVQAHQEQIRAQQDETLKQAVTAIAGSV